MDGAGEARIVSTIMTPLVKTTLATVGMILFLECWNDFLWPVIVIVARSADDPRGFALFKDPYGNINYGPLMAATVISTGPMSWRTPSRRSTDQGNRAHGIEGLKVPRGQEKKGHWSFRQLVTWERGAREGRFAFRCRCRISLSLTRGEVGRGADGI